MRAILLTDSKMNDFFSSEFFQSMLISFYNTKLLRTSFLLMSLISIKQCANDAVSIALQLFVFTYVSCTSLTQLSRNLCPLTLPLSL